MGDGLVLHILTGHTGAALHTQHAVELNWISAATDIAIISTRFQLPQLNPLLFDGQGGRSGSSSHFSTGDDDDSTGNLYPGGQTTVRKAFAIPPRLQRSAVQCNTTQQPAK